jgi:hypothetical protein
MLKLSAIAGLVMAAAFCCAEASPATAQVMKNFSWKKKQKPAKAQEATPEKAAPAEAAQPAQKKRKLQSGN